MFADTSERLQREVGTTNGLIVCYYNSIIAVIFLPWETMLWCSLGVYRFCDDPTQQPNPLVPLDKTVCLQLGGTFHHQQFLGVHLRRGILFALELAFPRIRDTHIFRIVGEERAWISR